MLCPAPVNYLGTFVLQQVELMVLIDGKQFIKMRSRFKIAFAIRFSEKSDPHIVKDLLIKNRKKETKKFLVRHSKNILGWSYKCGYHSDDITQNMLTMICSGWAFKVPRIVAKRIVKNIN